jgi:peptidyl-prolyl cis-trans isomerase D
MGIVGWIVLAILFVAFAFFGLNSYLGSNVVNFAAAVNDTEITSSQHQRAYQRLRARMQELMGESFDPATINEEALKATALKQLISEELILQAAETEGFASSDQLVAAQIGAIEAFRENGTFSKARYETVLRQQGMGPREFEWRLARELMANQYRSAISQTAAATREELARAYLLQAQQRRFSYLLLPQTGFAEQVTVTDADLEEYYAAHNEAFVIPERVRLQYLELDATQLETGIEVGEDALQALYDEQAEKFVTPEERHARHILVQLPPDADTAATGSALARAEAIVARLDGGEAFEALAQELSDDPGSAANGGDLGFFGRGMMTPAFETAVFDLTQGERSAPVKSTFGYHIIELLEIREETATPLAEVRDTLVDQLLSEARSDVFYEKYELLSSLTFEQPDTLQGAAEELGLQPGETDWISRSGGTGIGEHAAVAAAAFSEDVLENGNNSPAIEIGTDHVVVIRILDRQQAARQPFESVVDVVREQVLAEKARTLATEQGGQLLATLQADSKTLDAIAGEHELQVQQTELIARNAQQPAAALVRRAFTLAAPEAGQRVYDGFITAAGDYALLALEEVQDGDFDALEESARKQAWNSLNRVQGATELATVLEALETQASIRLPEPAEDQ